MQFYDDYSRFKQKFYIEFILIVIIGIFLLVAYLFGFMFLKIFALLLAYNNFCGASSVAAVVWSVLRGGINDSPAYNSSARPSFTTGIPGIDEDEARQLESYHRQLSSDNPEQAITNQPQIPASSGQSGNAVTPRPSILTRFRGGVSSVGNVVSFFSPSGVDQRVGTIRSYLSIMYSLINNILYYQIIEWINLDNLKQILINFLNYNHNNSALAGLFNTGSYNIPILSTINASFGALQFTSFPVLVSNFLSYCSNDRERIIDFANAFVELFNDQELVISLRDQLKNFVDESLKESKDYKEADNFLRTAAKFSPTIFVKSSDSNNFYNQKIRPFLERRKVRAFLTTGLNLFLVNGDQFMRYLLQVENRLLVRSDRALSPGRRSVDSNDTSSSQQAPASIIPSLTRQSAMITSPQASTSLPPSPRLRSNDQVTAETAEPSSSGSSPASLRKSPRRYLLERLQRNKLKDPGAGNIPTTTSFRRHSSPPPR